MSSPSPWDGYTPCVPIPPSEVAIIGMSCKLPGSVNSPSDLWSALLSGKDCITKIPPSRWNVDVHTDRSHRGDDTDEANYEKMRCVTDDGGVVDHFDEFDPLFFGISPKEGMFMDPQQRQLVECTMDALNDAGLTLSDVSHTKTAVLIGAMSVDWLRQNSVDTSLVSSYIVTGTASSILANRISYLFNLLGPSMVFDTACSSSMTAFHLGCEFVRSGECEYAIIGGTNLIFTPYTTGSMNNTRMLSPDGRCKTFDDGANGYVRSEGTCVFVIKRVSLPSSSPPTPTPSPQPRLFPRVYSLVRGSGINADGRTEVPMTAPSTEMQVELMNSVQQKFHIPPHLIGFVEAHGTGTKKGDPAEVGGIAKAISIKSASQRTPTEGKNVSPIYIGSLKSNLGHTESTAGLASLCKVSLCIRNGRIPPNIHVKKLNAEIPFDEWGLKVPLGVADWPVVDSTPNEQSKAIMPTAREQSDGCDDKDVDSHQGLLRTNRIGRRVAAVNSFGFGGANGHAVLEQPYVKYWWGDNTQLPVGEESKTHTDGRYGVFPLVLSAHNAETLIETVKGILQHLIEGPPKRFVVDENGKTTSSPLDPMKEFEWLSAVCLTLSHHRTLFSHRLTVVGRNRSDLIDRLSQIIELPLEERFRSIEGKISNRTVLLGGFASILFDPCGAKHFVGKIVGGAKNIPPPPPLVMVFGGIGTQYLGVGRLLLSKSDTFRKTISMIDDVVFKKEFEGKFRWRSIGEFLEGADNLPNGTSKGPSHDSQLLSDGALYQCALFAIQIGLLHMWRELSICPFAVLSHSWGEFAAAYACGRLSLRQAALLCVRTSVLLSSKWSSTPSSALVTVTGEKELIGRITSEASAKSLEAKGVHIACVNSEGSITLSASPSVINHIEDVLKDLPINADGRLKEVVFIKLLTMVPFHSPQMESFNTKTEFFAQLKDLHITDGDRQCPFANPPKWYSSVSGAQMGETFTDTNVVDFFWRMISQKAQFAAANQQLVRDLSESSVDVHSTILLDVNWSGSLRTAVEENFQLVLPSSSTDGSSKASLVPLSIVSMKRDSPDDEVFASAASQLFGLSIPLSMFSVLSLLSTVPSSLFHTLCVSDLPKYGWVRQHLWVEGPLSSAIKQYVAGNTYVAALPKLAEVLRAMNEGKEVDTKSGSTSPQSMGWTLPSVNFNHPFLHNHPEVIDTEVTVGDTIERKCSFRWRFDANPNQYLFLQDHVVDGTILFPGSGHVELAAAAFKFWCVLASTDPSLPHVEDPQNPQFVLKSLQFLQAFSLEKSTIAIVTLTSSSKLSSKVSSFMSAFASSPQLDIVIAAADDSVFASGVLQSRRFATDTWPHFEKDCREKCMAEAKFHMEGSELWTLCEDRHLHFGETFRLATHSWLSDKWSMGKVEITEEKANRMRFDLNGGDDGWMFHPSLLDTLWHCGLAELAHRNVDRVFPIHLERLFYFGKPKGRVFFTNSSYMLYTITDTSTINRAFNENGEPICLFQNLHSKVSDSRPPQHIATAFLLEEWQRAANIVVEAPAKGTSTAKGLFVGMCDVTSQRILETSISSIQSLSSAFVTLPQNLSDALSSRSSQVSIPDSIPTYDEIHSDLQKAILSTIRNPQANIINEASRNDDPLPLVVAFLWPLSATFDPTLPTRHIGFRTEFISFVAIAIVRSMVTSMGMYEEEIAKLGVTKRIAPHILFGTANAQHVENSSKTSFVGNPISSSILGALRCIRREHPEINALSVDVDNGVTSSPTDFSTSMKHFADEISHLLVHRPAEATSTPSTIPEFHADIAYRDGTRWIALLKAPPKAIHPSISNASSKMPDKYTHRLMAKNADDMKRVVDDNPARTLGRYDPLELTSPDHYNFVTSLSNEFVFASTHRALTRPSFRKGSLAYIRVQYVGLNFKDIFVLRQEMDNCTHPEAGFEFAGVVSEICDSPVPTPHGLQRNDRVFGLIGGGLASHAWMNVANIRKIPDGVPSFLAAGVFVCVMTAVCVFRHHPITKNTRVLVHAATGGAGYCIATLACQRGATVFVTAGSNTKRDFLRAKGFTVVGSSREVGDLRENIMSATDGEGVDYVVTGAVDRAVRDVSMQLLSPCGKYIDLGLDPGVHAAIKQKGVAHGCSVVQFDLAVILGFCRAKYNEQLVEETFALVDTAEKIQQMYPVIMIHSIRNLKMVASHMVKGKHIGKFVFAWDDEEHVREMSKESTQSVTSRPDFVVYDAIGLAKSSAPTSLRRKSSFIIVGGVRGIGLQIAKHFAKEGADCLVLLSLSGRMGPADIEYFQKKYPHLRVEVCQVDIANADQLGRLFERLLSAPKAIPPIRGIVQGAILLDDALILSVDPTKHRRVLAPKVDGSWNLHKMSVKFSLPLDFFVLLSSAVTWVGNVGQASYTAANMFMDALASYRRSQGLCCTSFALGAISDVGVFVDRGLANTPFENATPVHSAEVVGILHAALNRWRAKGTGENKESISTTAEVSPLYELIKSTFLPIDQLAEDWTASLHPSLSTLDSYRTAILRMDWQHTANDVDYKVHRYSSFLSSSNAQSAANRGRRQDDANSNNSLETLRSLPREEMIASVRQFVSELVASCAQISVSKLDHSTLLSTYGMDSVMSVDIRMGVHKQYGVLIPLVFILQQATIAGIVARIVAEITSKGSKSGGNTETAAVKNESVKAPLEEKSKPTPPKPHSNGTPNGNGVTTKLSALPPKEAVTPIPPTECPYVFCTFGKNADFARRLNSSPFLSAPSESSLSISCSMLQMAAYTSGRPHAVRVAVVATNSGVARKAIEENLSSGISATESNIVNGHLSPTVYASEPITTKTVPPCVSFLFPGQGAQWPLFARSLYMRFETFQRHFDECLRSQSVSGSLRADLKRLLIGDVNDSFGLPNEEALAQLSTELSATRLAQPALFIVEYCMAMQLIELGITPICMVGHSLGEYTSAVLRGVFTSSAGLALVVTRGEVMQSLQTSNGGMLALKLCREEVVSILESLPPQDRSQVSIGAENSPIQIVLSGNREVLRRIEKEQKGKGIRCKWIGNLPFHRPMDSNLIAKFRTAVSKALAESTTGKAPFNIGDVAHLSNFSGKAIPLKELQTVDYWVNHLVSTVLFHSNANELLDLTHTFTETHHCAHRGLLVEVGPGTTLGDIVAQSERGKILAEKQKFPMVVSTMPTNDTDASHSFLEAVSRCWVAGVDVEWEEMLKTYHYREEHRVEYDEVGRAQSLSTWRSEVQPSVRSISLSECESVLNGERLPHHFISINEDEWIVDFSASKGYVCIGRNAHKVSGKVLEKVSVSDGSCRLDGIRLRLENVLGLKNYSLMRKGSEHISRYVVDGVWSAPSLIDFNASLVGGPLEIYSMSYFDDVKQQSHRFALREPVSIAPKGIVDALTPSSATKAIVSVRKASDKHRSNSTEKQNGNGNGHHVSPPKEQPPAPEISEMKKMMDLMLKRMNEVETKLAKTAVSELLPTATLSPSPTVQSDPLPYILGIGTAVPGQPTEQMDLINSLIKGYKLEGSKATLVEKLGHTSMIEHRHLCEKKGGYEGYENRTFDDINDDYFREAPPLATQAARRAIEDWGGQCSEITHVIGVTCTGVMVPGVEFSVAIALGLPQGTQRLSIQFMGCFGALSGLKAAKAIAAENPTNRVLVVCCELNSLHLQRSNEVDALVAMVLFGDGSGAMVIGSGLRPHEKPIYAIHKSTCHIIPNSQGFMRWDFSLHGMSVRLAKEIPQKIYDNIGPFAVNLFKDTPIEGTTFGKHDWAIHPGGPMIVQSIIDQLKLDYSNAAAAYEVLRRYGNMSSGTLIFVLNQLRESAQRGGGATPMDWVPAVAFGPGLNVEGALLRWCGRVEKHEDHPSNGVNGKHFNGKGNSTNGHINIIDIRKADHDVQSAWSVL